MNNDIQKKLFNYQAEPPAVVWNDIETALQNEEISNYTNKLYHFEEQPPEETWEKINTQLNAGKPAAIHFLNFLKIPAKYAAAIFILVVIGAVLVLNNSTIGISHLSSALINKKNKTERTHTADDYNSTTALSNLQATNLHNHVAASNISASARYVIFNTAQGEQLKVSKKLYSWFDCAYNASSPPCIENMNRFQQQMISSSIAPANDFMGMMDILKTLQEKQ